MNNLEKLIDIFVKLSKAFCLAFLHIFMLVYHLINKGYNYAKK